MLTTPTAQQTPQQAPARTSVHRGPLLLLGIFLSVYVASLWSPSLLDDADATHAQAAQHMALSGDWVTLYVNGVRYLEKPPLPYWLVAIDYKLFGFNAFATHLPLALSVLLLAALGWRWSLLAWGERTANYAALGILTSAGVFLFTRYFIPDVLLTLFLSVSLYCFLRGLDLATTGRSRALHIYAMYLSLACAVLTKGLIAPVFFGGTVVVYLFLTGELCRWRELRPFSGTLLFLAIAAPWHILAGLRNPGEGIAAAIPTPGNHHGFWWFYFINEHVLRFLGKRYPMDYNKLPGYLYWSLHLVWLFPWSLFLPVVLREAWLMVRPRPSAAASPSLQSTVQRSVAKPLHPQQRVGLHTFRSLNFAGRTTLLLSLYSALVLIFFSLSTNQEYYTFPTYLPLLMLTAAALVRTEQASARTATSRCLTGAHAFFTVIGIAIALALAYGLWSARHLPYVADIGDLLAHRGVGDYTLSMSHFFDLTGQSFAALRLPAALALFAFAAGPAIGWWLRRKRRAVAATTALALTSAAFLIAAHIALVRFGPMLSSRDLADKFDELVQDDRISATTGLYLYGDQSYGSSIPFYTGRMVYLVNARSSSMIWGSTYSDAPRIFLTGEELAARWGTGERKIMFVPLEKRDEADALLGKRQIVIEETSGKALVTDRPLP